MKLSRALSLRRYRDTWQDPVRRHRTLQSFSETEDDGGKDLVLAAKRVTDPELRQHLERHALDERRHAAMFRQRAAEVRALAADNAGSELSTSERAFDLAGTRRGAEFDAHGSFNAGICDELGEVAYVAMLHVAEKRAAEVFELHRALNAHDPETQAVFDAILKDEKYHIAYTGRFLDKWRREGRAVEVEAGLADARSSRFVGSWKRLGVRSGASLSRGVLLVMYWTVLLPFGLCARRGQTPKGWRAVRAEAESASQY